MQGCIQTVGCFFQSIGILACITVAAAMLLLVNTSDTPRRQTERPSNQISLRALSPSTNLPEPTPTPLPTPPLPTPLPTQQIAHPIAIINAPLYSGPGTDTAIAASVAQGQHLHITGVLNDGSWYQISSSYWIEAHCVADPPVDLPVYVAMTQELPAQHITQHSTEPQPTEPPVIFTPVELPPTQSAPCSCSADQYNCTDFATSRQAQACHDFCRSTVGYDIHRLDGNDADGLACESL